MINIYLQHIYIEFHTHKKNLYFKSAMHEYILSLFFYIISFDWISCIITQNI